MATESERCVDELLSRNAKIDSLVAELEKQGNTHDESVLANVRNILSETNSFIENNKSIIPSYCLKKISDSLRKLQVFANKPSTVVKFQFKSSAKPKDASTQIKDDTNKPGDNDDRSRVKPPIASLALGFQDKHDEELRLGANEVEGKDISLINLTGCRVTIHGLANTVYIRDLKNTTVSICLACRAITIANCTDSNFKLVCQQLRIDSTKASKFTLFTSARSMLEASERLEFGRLDLDQVEGLTEVQILHLLSQAKFDASQNNWRCIDDFDWLSPNTKSKNYTLVEPVT